jgi:hypothetical protein
MMAPFEHSEPMNTKAVTVRLLLRRRGRPEWHASELRDVSERFGWKTLIPDYQRIFEENGTFGQHTLHFCRSGPVTYSLTVK